MLGGDEQGCLSMFTLSIVVMLASGTELPNYTMPPARPRAIPMTTAPSRCIEDCDSRYRLPSAVDSGPSAKKRALAEDGGECNVVGAKLCTTTPRTILRSTY